MKLHPKERWFIENPDAAVQAGPGTRLKNFLEKHGITEEWYRSMKQEVGLLPECDCEMRRHMLDETWAAYKTGGWKAAKMAYSRVKEYYAKPR